MRIDPPEIPEFRPVGFDKTQGEHLSLMSSTLADASSVTTRAAEKSQESLIAQLERAIPGYKNMVTAATRNISDLLSGKVQDDVANRLADRANAQAARWGMAPRSEVARNLELRDFGLSSMDSIQKGLDSMQQFIRTQDATATVRSVSPTSLYMTAQDRLRHTEQERTSEFNRNLYQSEVAAAATQANQQLGMAGRASSFDIMPPTGQTRSWMSNNYQTSVGGLASRQLTAGLGAGRNPISFSNFGGMAGGGRDISQSISYGMTPPPSQTGYGEA